MSARIEKIFERILGVLLGTFLFLLPWGTVWIYRLPMLGGSVWQYGVEGWYATEVLFWIICVFFTGWTMSRFRRSRMKIRFAWTPDRQIILALLAFLLWVYGTMLWAVDASLALTHATRVMAGVLLVFILAVGPYNRRNAFVAFVAGALVQAGFGVWQFVTQTTVASTLFGLSAHPAFVSGSAVVVSGGERWLRAYAAFPHPNIFGGYIVAAIMLTIGFVMVRDGSKYSRFASVATLFMLMTGLFVSLSRSAWLSAVLGIFAMIGLARHLGNRWMVGWLAVLLGYFGLLMVIAWPLVVPRFAISGTLETRSITERAHGYAEAITLIQKKPFGGTAIGNYTAELHHDRPGMPGWFFQPVHQVPLFMVAELGLIGVGIFVLLVYMAGRYLLADHRERWWVVFVFTVPLIPIVMLDHYVWSLYIGLMTLMTSFGLAIGVVCPQLFHTLSTIREKS